MCLVGVVSGYFLCVLVEVLFSLVIYEAGSNWSYS